MKKLAEELLKIESNARRVEAEKAQLEDDCRSSFVCNFTSIFSLNNFIPHALLQMSNVQGL